MNQANRDLVAEVSKLLRHNNDILKLILRIKKVESHYGDWHKLYVSLESGLQICRLVHAFCNDKSRFLVDYISQYIAMTHVLLM